jgi:hypothetical protein
MFRPARDFVGKCKVTVTEYSEATGKEISLTDLKLDPTLVNMFSYRDVYEAVRNDMIRKLGELNEKAGETERYKIEYKDDPKNSSNSSEQPPVDFCIRETEKIKLYGSGT